MKGWSFLKINDLLHLFDSKVDIATSEHSNNCENRINWSLAIEKYNLTTSKHKINNEIISIYIIM